MKMTTPATANEKHAVTRHHSMRVEAVAGIEYRARSQTLPAGALRTLRADRTSANRSKTGHVLSAAESNPSDSESQKNRTGSQHRARAHTLPTAVLRRLKDGAVIAARTRDVTERSCDVSDRRNDVISRSRINVAMSNRRDSNAKPTNTAVVEDSPMTDEAVIKTFSALDLIDRCIHEADDQSMTVHREPLPPGSLVFETVIHQLDPGAHAMNSMTDVVTSDAKLPAHSILHVDGDHGHDSAHLDTCLDRHVHWKGAGRST